MILPVEVSTIDATVALPVIGTIGTILASGPVGFVATIGTLVSGAVTVVAGTIGTIQAPVVAFTGNLFSVSTVFATGAVSATVASTLVAATLQAVVVDSVYGTVVAGSILTAVVGVEPQTGKQTATIVAGTWVASTIPSSQRIRDTGPLGFEFAVVVETALGGTIGAGSVLGVSVTAQQSAVG